MEHTPSHKSEIRNGKEIHFSVGAIITNRKGELLLIERRTPPPGFAGVAGHLDTGEVPEQAIIREVREESGIEISNPKLIAEEFIDWNWCDGGVTGHHWYLFTAEADGELTAQEDEVKSVGWYAPDKLGELNLEEVWEYWFKKFGYL